MAYQGGRLSDGTPLNVAVYRAYRNAGLSHTQALAVTAEVGRENSFNPNILFGSHIDPAANSSGGAIRNIGMLSWNGGRGKNIAGYLQSRGLLGSNGMVRNQDNLNAQAAFSVREMQSKAYRGGLQNFWNNPNANPETYSRELGKNYIAWAYGQNTIRAKGGGRVAFNWQEHDARRRNYLNTLGGMLGDKSYKPQSGGYATRPNSADLFFIGDSIAHGYRSKGQGITKVGMNPQWILGQIQSALAKNPNALQGKTVVLSSGLSNNTNDIKSIESQLQALKRSGANVVLLGVANSFKGNANVGGQLNSTLQSLANKYGATFNGGFTPNKTDYVHPASYKLSAINLPQVGGYEPQQQMGQFGSIDEALAAQKQSQPMGKFSSIDEALAAQRQAEPLGKYASIDEAIAAQQPKGQYASVDEALSAQQPSQQMGQFGSIDEALKHLNGG